MAEVLAFYRPAENREKEDYITRPHEAWLFGFFHQSTTISVNGNASALAILGQNAMLRVCYFEAGLRVVNHKGHNN
jgi:hypothetical protein